MNTRNLMDGDDHLGSTTEAEIQALFAAMDDLVLVRDAHGRCQKVLTPHSRLLFQPAETVIGQTLHDNLPLPIADYLLTGIQEALQHRHTVQREYHLQIGDRTVWLDAWLTPITDQLVMAVIRDVSDRKQLEISLSHSQAQLQAILDQANAGIVNFQFYPQDFRLAYLYYSAGCEDLYGYTAADLLTDQNLWRSRVHPDDWQTVLLPAFSQLIEAPTHRVEIEYRFYHSNQSLRWIAESASAVWDDTQQCWSVITVARDISDRKQLEAEQERTLTALREQENRLRLTLALNQIGSWDWDLQSGEITWDTQFARLIGIAPTIRPPCYQAWQQCIHPDDLAQLERAVADVVAHPRDFHDEYRVIHPDGSVHWIADKGSVLYDDAGNLLRLIGITADISDRKATEMALQTLNDDLNQRVAARTEELQTAQIALKQQEQHLRNLLETIPDVIAQFDRDLRCVYVNAAITKLTGRLPQAYAGKHITEADLPDPFIRSVINHLQHTLASGEETVVYYEYPTPQGITYFQSKLVPEFNGHGEIEAVLVIYRNITDLKATEIALRRSEEQFRTLFDVTPLPLSLADMANGQLVRVNTAYQTWLGYNNAELYTQSFLNFIYTEDLDSDRRLHKAMQTGDLHQFQARKRFIKKSGEVVWADTWVTSIPDESGQPLYSLCLSQDVTQAVQLISARNQAEANLRVLVQEKDILLKEVHHRVKNNLQIISSLLRMQARLVDSQTAELFQEAQNRVQSIAIIHEHLYQSADLSQINFQEYVQILVNNLLCSYGITQHVQVQLDIQPVPLGLNLAIPCGLIINELVSNSLKYAFENAQSGEIKICLSSQPKQAAFNENEGILIVQDNGIGFPTDVNWRSSRSLGLRIVCALVEQISGTIRRTDGKGTSFRIAFPLLPIPSESTTELAF